MNHIKLYDYNKKKPIIYFTPSGFTYKYYAK